MAYRHATVADVNDPTTGVAPGLTFPTGQIQLWIDITQEWVGLAVFKTQSSQYHALLVAHMLTTLPEGDGEAGPVVSEAHGPASRSFAAPAIAPGDEALSGTPYGRAALMIRKTVSPLPVRMRSGYP